MENGRSNAILQYIRACGADLAVCSANMHQIKQLWHFPVQSNVFLQYIVLNGVHVTYGRAAALREVTLHLPYGKIYGLIGRNGAGKTTLLSLIGSFLEPTSGKVAIGGRPAFENAEVMSRVTLAYAADYSEESDTVRGMLESSERYRPDFDRQYADYLATRFELPALR